MIDTALHHITRYLNQACKNAYGLSEDICVVSNLADPDGSPPAYINSKLIVSLVSVVKDGMHSPFSIKNKVVPQTGVMKHPPVHFNLLVMVSACFSGSKYIEGLKFLSYAVYFFQRNPIFDGLTTPDLDASIDKMVLDIENIDLKDFSSVWSVISGKYMPSVLYRIRMITMDSDAVNARVPLLNDIRIKGGLLE